MIFIINILFLLHFIEIICFKSDRHAHTFCVFLGFDVGDLSEDGPDDIEGLDASAMHVSNLLSTEPADSMFPASKKR